MSNNADETKIDYKALPIPTIGAGWQPAVLETLAEKVKGKLIAYHPIAMDTRVNEDGESQPVTICVTFDLSDDEPELFDRAFPVGWVVVQEQLRKATPESPWIIGYIEQKGRAWVLQPPKPEDFAKLGDKLRSVEALIPIINAAESVETVKEAPTSA